MRQLMIRTVVVLLVSVPLVSAFGLDGDEILAAAQDAMNPSETMHSIASMSIIGSRGNRENRRVEIFRKDAGSGASSDYYLVRFLEPADIRGVAVLVLPDGAGDRIYLYLPEFRRERRIAGHVRNDTFMGTDLTYDDIARRNYTADYQVINDRDDGDTYILELIRRRDDVTHSRVIMHVDKDTFLPVRTLLYDGGTLVKRITVSRIRIYESFPTVTEMTVEHVETGSRTTLITTDVHYGQAIGDETFSVRNLRRFR